MRDVIVAGITVGMLAAGAGYAAGDESKMRASDTGEYDQFGDELATDGNHLIVGASHYGERGGAAYVYAWDGAVWGNEVKLEAHDHTKNDFFGSDVDIDGERALVGARWHDPHDRMLRNHTYGAGYFYQHSGRGWVQESFVQASDRTLNHEFGGAVALSGDHAVIGAVFSAVGGEPNQGKAYVFHYNDGDWTESQILTAPDGGASDHFGASVDIDGDYLFVGGTDHARPSDGQNTGAVWVFKRNSKNKWDFESKLAPAELEDGNAFGSSIHIADDVAVVGAQLAYGNESGSGTAYVFRLSGGAWKKEVRLKASGGRQGDDFGHRVWIGGDQALIGAWLSGYGEDLQKGAAYVFQKTGRGWIESVRLSASDGGYEDQFGSAVAVGAGQVVVGASGDSASEEKYKTGAIYWFGGVLDL